MSEPISCPASPDYDAASRAQAIAADPDHSAWVSANAGSGKTKVLIDRVARLLLKGAAPNAILCVTYTKAAANEMLQRLFDRLGKWSVMDEAELRTELTELEGRSGSSYTDDDIREARALFARALETPGGLRIETIHSFCSRVLRRFPLEANIAPGFGEIDDIDAERLWQQALETGLQAADLVMPDVLDTVSLAGGGRGAIAGLTAARRSARLVLDFATRFANNTDALARALKDALKAPDASEEELIAEAMGAAMPVTDLRAACAVLLEDGKRDSLRTANAIQAALLADRPDAKWHAYQRAFFGGSGPYKALYNAGARANPLIPQLFETKDIPEGSEVLRIHALAEALRAARLYARTHALIQLAAPVLAQYRDLKRHRAAVDFDDLIAFTHALLTRKEAAGWVLYKLDGGLTHVLLDEAQDTSPDQWGVLNALTEEFFAGKGIEKAQDPRTLFVVGDEKQSIYSFQGADPQRFLSERQRFEARARDAFGKAELPEMQMSFRSSPEILQFVDKVSECGDVDGHPYIAGPVSEANISRHTARRANQPGSVELWPVDVPEADEDAIAWDAPRDTQSAASPKNKLAQKVAGEIDRMVNQGDMIWAEGAGRKWSLRPATPGDVLILVDKRTGGLFDALIDALKARNIPVAGADRLVLADHIGVQDCLNLIRFVLLPDDDLTVAEIMRGPFGGLVDDDAHLFELAYERTGSLWQALQASPDPAHKPLAVFLSALQALAHLPAYEFLSHILERPGASGMTGWAQLAARLGPPMRDPVQALLARAIAHDAQDAASLQGFMARMDLDRTQIKRDLAAPNGEVRVMTVHGAKGLQAPIVILPDTTRTVKTDTPPVTEVNKVPVWLSSASEDTPTTEQAREALKTRQLRERRRLLYVALTRAQDRLIICGHWSGHRPKPDKPSGKGYGEGCWYGLCAEAMGHLLGKPETETDAPHETRRFGPAPQTITANQQELSKDGQHPAQPAWLAIPAPAETGTARIVAPTALVPGETPVLPPMDAARADRLKRGRLIHALLERLPALPVETRRTAGTKFLDQDKSLTAAARSEMLEAAMTVLEDPAFAGVFVEHGRAEASVIGTAPTLPDGIVINGRVDRLVVSETEVLIIDFKTDRPPPKRAEDVAKPYLAQMAAYASVLGEAYPGRKIRAALIWTDGPALMELAPDLLAEALSHSSGAV